MEELQKLYDVLVREGKYSKSFGEFQAKWAQDQAYKEKVYSVVTRDGLYSKDKDSFLQKYSSNIPETQEPQSKKKVSSELPKPQAPKAGTTELPSADGSLATPPTKKTFATTDMSGKSLFPEQKEFGKALKKGQAENKALESEKKKYGDIFDKQLNIKPKVDENQYLKDRLSSVNTELIDREEEYVVPQLKYQFGDLGFNFEESGATGDYVKVTAPNGKTTEISLDNFSSSKSKSESEVLQKFIKDNTPAKGLFVLEKTMREQDKKFNSEKQVDDSVKVISNEVNALNAKQKEFLIKKSSFEKDLNILGLTPELEQKRLALNEEMKSILQEEETIKQKGNRLSTAVGKYSISKSKQGTWGGALANAINEGFSSIAAGTTSLATDIATEIAPTGFGMSPKDLRDVSINIANKIGAYEPRDGQTIEQWKATLTEDQLDKWEDEIDDYIKKDIKAKALPLIRIGNREIFGDADTTKQFSDLKEKGFWGGAILGVAKSLPAMIGSTSVAGWAQRTAQMYAQISDALAVEMENDPSFKNISENEKLAITLPIGVTSAVLEAYGLRNVMASKGVINSITLSVLGKAGVGASAKTFRELVENEVESKIARGLLTVTAAGVAEFETGAAQEATETGFKVLYDKIKGEDMFDTPDSKIDLVENILVAGAQEAVGGFVLGVPSGVSAAYAKKGFLKMDDASFEMFANMANDEKMQSAYITSLKEKITQGIITEKDAKEQLNNYRNSAGLYRQLPEGLSTEQQKEAMNLLKEKRDLENFVSGKDAALVVKQKNRITEINNSLTKLSETNAIQEQTTDESVLRTEQPELGLQEMGEGDTKPGEVTEQATQEEVTPSETITPTPDEISQPIELSVPSATATQPEEVKGTFLDNILDKIYEYNDPITGGKLKGNVFFDGQEIVFTDGDKEFSLGTVQDALSSNSLNATEVTPTFNISEDGTIDILQETEGIPKGKITPQGTGLKAIKTDKNGNVKRVVITDSNGVTHSVKGELANELADFMMLDLAKKGGLIRKINTNETARETFNRGVREASAKRKSKDTQTGVQRLDRGGRVEEAPTPETVADVVTEPAPVTEAPVVESKIYYQGIPKGSAYMQAIIDENGKTLFQGSLEGVEKFKKDNGISSDKVSMIDLDTSNPNSLISKILKEKTKPTEVQAKAEPTPVVETEAILEEAPVVKPKQTKAEQTISEIDKAIQALFARNGQDTDTWVNQSDNRDLIALKRAKKALQTDAKTFKTFLDTTMGKRYSEMAAKFETSEKQVEVNDLLSLDTKDKKSLKKVYDFLDGIDKSLDLDPNELNDVTRVMAIATAKAVVKTLKALVNAGITLQKAIEMASEAHSVTPEQITDALDIVSKINENKSEGISEMELPGYNKFSSVVDSAISGGKTIDVVMNYVNRSEVYKNASDVQKELLVREVRNKFGLKEKSAPSVGKLFGTIKDIKKITMTEKSLLIKQIRDKIKGAKDAIKTIKEVSQQLVKEIKELESTGKITTTQALNMISKFSKVNMLNEVSVYNFVDYMSKVFADADYDNKINVAKGRLKNAKKNIATKIGIADGLAFPLQTLFSINPSLIPIKNLEKYMELVDMFSERKAILQLGEISEVTKDVNEILDEIDNELSIADELSFRLNYSDNKVFDDDDNLDYAATVKNMLKEGDITQEEAEIMTKYKSEIIPQVEKSKATDEEIAKEKEDFVNQLKKSTVDSNELPTRDERNIAKRIADHLKKPFINQLSNKELSNLLKGIDNINNGYLPHQVELILEKLDSFADGKVEANVMRNANLKKISQLVNTVYNSIKSKFTPRDAIFEMIRRTPLFNIDQILGNFKTEELFYSLLGNTAKAEAKFSFELKTIQEKLKKAQDKVAKSFSLDPEQSKISSYKIKTYLIQLEHDTNSGDERVNQASKYIDATIKHIKRLRSQYNKNDVEILEDILKKFAPDGNIDIDKLYNSFNSAEKEAIKTIQEIKKFESEKAEFTAAVIRGKRINALNNHTHISVLSDDGKGDLDTGVSIANDYSKSLRPSTKAKSLIERTPGAKPINFDAYSTALRSVQHVLLDYHLTSPIRTARKSLIAAEADLQKDGEMSEEQRRIFNSVEDAFELAVKDLVMNNYVQTSMGQDIVNFISKQGYRAVLAGLGKSSIELLSNLGYVVYDPGTFYKGIEYMGVLLSKDGPAIMNNSKSIQTNRVFASGLSGRMIDLGILDQTVGTKSTKTRGKFINKAQQIWNLTAKKFIKNPVELTADALISSPDKVIMRPYWLGSYITELEKQLGRKVTKEDLKKIAENDEQYMNENEDAIESSTRVADRKSKLMGATKNAFAGLLRGKVREEDKAGITILKNFNAFMTNFMVYEYNAAKTGIMAAIGEGTMTRSEGAAVLAGVITRMTVYNLLIKSTSAGISGLIGSAFGLDDDEEEEEKSVNQMVTQSLTSTFASLLLGRDFGNISKTVVNYAFEEFVTKEYLEGLRTGEYDPYKDAVLFNSLQRDEKTGEIELWENIPNFMGSYGPMAKTTALAVKSFTANEKKEADAIERQEKERNIRLPLEILGNAGYVPLYKEIRKAVMDDIYKGLRTKKSDSGVTKEELKKLDPEMYRIMYGND